MNALSIFVAVVLGSSLIEFNEFLFPPMLSSMAFWGMVPCYWVAVTAWFATMAWGKYAPYLDKPASRAWVTFTMGAWTAVLALMFFARGLPESILSYMWGVVALNIFYWLAYIYRHRDTGSPEPFRLLAIFSTLALSAATAYSICALVFSPVPEVVNWIFVFIAFAILVGYRLALRWRHVWRPEERK
jgi:hypothetical protein